MDNFLIMLNPVAKWLHIIAGIMWIGLLYFFNFINGHVAATMDGDSKKKVVPELMPRALYWFRWGAAWTWFTGIILLYVILWNGSLSMGESDVMMSSDVNMYTHMMILATFLAVFVYAFLYKVVSVLGPSTEITKSSPFLPSKEPKTNISAPVKPVLIPIDLVERSATSEAEKQTL